MPKVGRQIKRLKNHGYPIKNVLDILQNDNDTHTIVYTSPEFQPCADTFSDKYAFVRASVRPAREEIVKTRDKLLYISMGTVNNDMLPFYEQCIRALAGTDYQVLLSVGNAGRISEGFRKCGGAERAADKILEVIEKSCRSVARRF